MKGKVVIFGGGLMGAGIACISALAGHPTVLVDLREELAQRGAKTALQHATELVEAGLATPQACADAKQLLRVTCDKREACCDSSLLIEAIVERVDAKQALFCELEQYLAVDVPMLSNTSGLRITDICARMRNPERALTAHFWFPAYLVPLVEIVMHEKSSLSIAESVRNLLVQWGKAPVVVKRDQPGQLANRILQAMIREAVDIVESGLATPSDVDTAIKMGPGIRLPAWGILEHADAVGIDLVKRVQDSTLGDIARNTKASALLQKMLDNEQLGVKTGKGFYDWHSRSFSDLESLRNEMIVTAVKLMRTHKEGRE